MKLIFCCTSAVGNDFSESRMGINLKMEQIISHKIALKRYLLWLFFYGYVL